MGKRHEQKSHLGRHRHGQQAHEKMLCITCHQGNTDQNHNEIPPHTSENGENLQGRKQQMFEKMWRKGNTLALLVGMQTGVATRKTVWKFLKKLKTELWNWVRE